jgi:hypothetical protein
MADPDKTPSPSPKGERAPEPYPSVRQDDSVEAGEGRSFDPAKTAPPSTQEGRIGPEGDPAEGKR